jgi:hypothetical protein
VITSTVVIVHRPMPIVTIGIALRARSAEKQGSRQKTLTQVINFINFL